MFRFIFMEVAKTYALLQAANADVTKTNHYIRSLERDLGLFDTFYTDTTADRSYDVYKCKLCDRRWAALQKVPCWSCHPEEFSVFNVPITKKVPGIQLGDCDPEFMPQPHP